MHTTVKLRFIIKGCYVFCFISWIKAATIGIKTWGILHMFMLIFISYSIKYKVFYFNCKVSLKFS